MTWVYDIETYRNLFTVTFLNVTNREEKVFIIGEEHNDLDDLHAFINDHEKWLVGYNSFNFDNQLLNFLYVKHFDLTLKSGEYIADAVYSLARIIVESDFSAYKYNLPFRWIDLMKVGFYRKSLKLLGVSLKWPKLQDLPIPWENYIKPEEIQTVLEYNRNDVLITERLFHHLKDNITLRFNISKRYGVDAFSESDSGVANRLLEKFHSEATGLKLRDFKDLRTERKFIRFDWVVFDNIYFQTPELDAVLEEVKNYIVYMDHNLKIKNPFKKNVLFDGKKYQLGLGGIHSEDEGKRFDATEDMHVIDADIGSMYPATFINNNLSPAHLGPKFLKNFVKLRDERIEAKKKKDMTPAEGLKIVLNSAIGKTLNKNHWLYDPLVNVRVTINGQLYILMLIERLSLEGFKTISANTDGITTLVPKDREDEYYEICKTWEKETSYELEYAYYKTYARRDVNNYIAIKTDGEVKTKGIFIYDFPSRFSNMTDPLNKGWDKPIVSKALCEYFVNGTPIRDTIYDSNDIYDFCVARRIGDDFANEFHDIVNGEHKITKLQKSVRYYLSTNGGTLLKEKEDGTKTNYEANKRVTIFNDYVEKDMKDYNIDYAYYVHHTQKIIDEIINPQLSLLF